MILINDQWVSREDATVDIEDRGYQFGDGVYEVVRVYGGKPYQFDAHMKRLTRSMAAIDLTPPYAIDRIAVNLKNLIEQDEIEDGIVYFQITRGTATRNHAYPKEAKSVLTAYTRAMPRPLNQLEAGVNGHLVEDIRWLRCDIKSLNLLGNVMAKQAAVENGAGEAIFHRGDIVTEGSSSNLFIVKNGRLITHPANHYILNGITRKVVFDLAETLQIAIDEKTYTVGELLDAEEAFVTSTTQEVMPIVMIDDKKIGSGQPGNVTKQLQEAFNATIQQSHMV
ncbi:D-amino-acid transaminase [Camelliibacillus cellulosilyticus]|uniref:D-alanine aminotransferase n=1 Tax=Camelliibacillus cellulosilyticus TaxID=2174486 RepID=A0ABV9GLE7_9BACL